MLRPMIRSCLTALAMLVFILPAGADSVRIGVNAFFPTWGPAGMSYAAFRQQEASYITALKTSGVTLIRTDINTGTALFFYPGGGAKTPGYIHDLYAQGIATVLIVGPSGADYDPAPGCPRPVMPGERWPMQCLSAADPGTWRNAPQLQNSVIRQLDTVEAQGVKLAAIEVMNEFNWSNGDLGPGVDHKGRYLTLADLNNPSDPEAGKVAAGYNVYLRLLSVVKDWRDQSKLNRTTPIISGGLADWDSGGAPEDFVPIGVTLTYLRTHGLDDLVDGYGIHTYPAGHPISVALRIRNLDQGVLAMCRKSKPCWLTEWGFATRPTPCPLGTGPTADALSAELVTEMRQALHPFFASGRLANAMYFEWPWSPTATGGARGFGIYGAFASCNNATGLTRSGAIAIAPER